MDKVEHQQFDPGLRSLTELIWGPEPGKPGEIRGNTIRGRARYSRDEAIRAATRNLLPRLGDELRSLAKGRLRCGYVHGATSPTCKDQACQAWIDEVVRWHTERFGSRHFDLTLGAVLWMSTGRSPSLKVVNERWRDPSDPATVALDLGVKGAWVTANIGVRADATKADVHDLVDRLWPEVERMRNLAGFHSEGQASGRRAGRLDRPARASFWRMRQFQGARVAAIAAEWECLTRSWLDLSPDASVDARNLEFPAWVEWRRRGEFAGIERFEELGTLQRAIAKLRKLTA